MLRKPDIFRIAILAVVVLSPVLSHAFRVGDQISIKYSRHNLSALNQIEVDGGAIPANMEGYSYNNYGEICVYCHTPHNSSTDYDAPLWNRPTPSNTYDVYSSGSMDAATRQPDGVSLACLSCHDGTIAVDSVLNYRVITDPATQHRMMSRTGGSTSCAQCHGSGDYTDHTGRYLTTDLSDDHPISIVYNEAYGAQSPAEFADPNTIAPLRLFNGRVECASCHDVHSPNDPFDFTYPTGAVTRRSYHLRKSNRSSSLCLTCHIK